MLKATIQVGDKTITLEGEADEIGAALVSFGGTAPAPAASTVVRKVGRPPKQPVQVAAEPNGVKARKEVTPEVAKTRALQGRYLGALRAVSAADKKRLQKIAQSQGVQAAVTEADKIRAKTAKKA